MKKNKENNIKIDIKGEYIPELSNNQDELYYFLYKVKIHNNGKDKVQLLSRHWDIKDGLGRKKIVNGEGVIGKKPFINPGEFYEYRSYCPLKTEFGSMDGFYTMKDAEGNLFKTLIPNLGLVSPENIN